MNVNVIGSNTEIYSGVGFLTQAAPTNFHVFMNRKVLAKDEAADDWREETEAEKKALESSDAKWVAPSQSFIDELVIAVGNHGRYNASTGFFELNGLTDITYSEAMSIMLHGRFSLSEYGAGSIDAANDTTGYFRTNIVAPTGADRLRADCTFNHCCYGQSLLEVFSTGPAPNSLEYYAWRCSPKNLSGNFNGCKKLLRILGVVNLDRVSESLTDLPFVGCGALEEIHFHRLSGNLNLQNLPSLSQGSIREIIIFATNTVAVTVRLHPDAFARVDGGLAALAAEKNITFVTSN